MKTALDIDPFRRTTLAAEPGEYDGRPQLSERFVDLAPQRINRFRQSLATALPYLNSVNGALETETPMYPLTASLLREYGAPFEILATNIEWKPTDIPSGSGRLVIRLTDSKESAAPPRSTTDSYELRLARSDTYHGYLATTTGCVTGSNAWLADVLDGPEATTLTLTAFGVLFAEDFDARIVQIRCVEVPARAELLRRLAESVGLYLEFNQGDER